MYEIPKENSFSPQNGYAQLHFYQRYPSRRAMDTQIGEQNQNQDQILYLKKNFQISIQIVQETTQEKYQ